MPWSASSRANIRYQSPARLVDISILTTFKLFSMTPMATSSANTEVGSARFLALPKAIGPRDGFCLGATRRRVVLLLLDTAMKVAMQFAERLRKAIERVFD